MNTPGTCYDCVYWSRTQSVNIPNPHKAETARRFGRSAAAYMPDTISVAPCLNPDVCMCDTPNTVGFMDADATCEHYGDGFSPTHAAVLRQSPETAPQVPLAARRHWPGLMTEYPRRAM